MTTAAAGSAADGGPSSPPPLFALAHSNGKAAIAEARAPPDTGPVDSPRAQQQLEQLEEVDVSRAGVLLGQVDTPALACFTEHGAVPYLTRDLLLEIQSRHPRSFGLLCVDMKTSLPVKEGSPDPGTLEERACNPPGRFITCLGARDPLGGVAANCTPAQVSVDTLYGRRALSPAGHAALVARLKPTLATAIMDEAPSSASRTRQQKAVERSLAWLDHLLRAAATVPSTTSNGGGDGDGDAPEENASQQPAAAEGQRGQGQQQGVTVFILGGVVGGADLALRRQSARETVKRLAAATSSSSPAVGGGVSIGGLGMGESPQERRAVLQAVAAELPAPLLRACVGLSSPLELLDAMLAGGVDVINSPLPFQLTQSGHALAFPLEMDEQEEGAGAGGASSPTPKRRRLEKGSQTVDEPEGGEGNGGAILNLWDRRWRRDARPLVAGCPCLACRRHSRAYIHHLLLAHEMAGEVLLHAHNLEHVLGLFEAARRAILSGKLRQYRAHVQRAVGGESGGPPN